MSAVLYHLTDDGPKKCTASLGRCPFKTSHFENKRAAVNAYETQRSEEAFTTVKKTDKSIDPKTGFSTDAFYGELSPRLMQIDALNGVAAALEEDENTQLVAACGTGKSYMGRQLMRRMMETEDANGVAIVLTSSIKLVQDTASDLRPDKDGRYDHSLGEYGEDYVVIEVNSASKEFLESSTISLDKIADAWAQALDDGKKVVVVSTYESASKVQEVQARLMARGLAAEADLLMNDEAHNILGQQRSSSATTEGVNTGYRSFHNEIPGSIQSARRLYATATPVIPESVSDDNSTIASYDGPEEESLRILAMQNQALKMDADPKARITIYSGDSSVVGSIGGYISQETAIATNSLAKPDYQLRSALIKGNLTNARGGYVDATGTIITQGEMSNEHPNLSVQTYSALSATLNAMAANPEPGVNPVHNALAYCGSIEQARAFRDNFKDVALAQSEGISLSEAENARDADDPALRRRARMRLLADHVDAQAAYSGSGAELDKARKTAFGMFKGRSFTEADAVKGWSPDKRVLANVDIFSEGVSINEVDTVVISDDEKTSERAMTQAIGRAIRRVPSNPYKATGHVIIPQAVGSNGEELNGGSVALAAYGATRVERGVAISKLSGESAKPDESTLVTHYSPEGTVQDKSLASAIAKKHITSTSDVIVAHTLDRAHKELLRKDSSYKNLSASEQYAVMTSYIVEKAQTVKNKDAYWAYAANKVVGHTVNELNTVRQSNKVLVSALGSNDIGALSPELTKAFIQRGILKHSDGVKAEPTQKEKRELIKKNKAVITTALASAKTQASDPELHALVTGNVRALDVIKASNGKGDQAKFAAAEGDLEKALVNDTNVEKLYSFVARQPAKNEWSILHDPVKGADFRNSLAATTEVVRNRSANRAVAGEVKYELNRDAVRTVGDLSGSSLAALS